MAMAPLAGPDTPAFVKDPDYHISFETYEDLVEISLQGHLIARSRRAVVLRETRLDPVLYVPAEDIDFDKLPTSPHRTFCPFKGTATYWHFQSGDLFEENIAWSYQDPLPEAAAIAGHLAFYADKVECRYQGDPLGYQGINRSAENPHLDWLAREAWEAADAGELVARLSRQLLEQGFPLWRLNLLLGTLNPLVSGTGYIWKRGQEKIEALRLFHNRKNAPAFRNSPLVPIYEGKGGIRRRLEGDDIRLDFPILSDLKEEGATDYLAMPLHFSNGHINALTMATDRPGGFTTEELGQMYEILPLLARLFEVHALKASTQSVLSTYLGSRTAELVLSGRIERGDGEIIPAVVWSCDLRDSTGLASRLPREDYLLMLNDFFDCAAGAVMAEGGEVLKFIGDAILAIFPIEEGVFCEAKACQAALRAAIAFEERLAALNSERNELGKITLAAVVALHSGNLTYGNVGSRERLDFTVIGDAANEVARIQDIGKELGHSMVMTAQVAGHCGDNCRSLGQKALRGSDKSHELFIIA